MLLFVALLTAYHCPCDYRVWYGKDQGWRATTAEHVRVGDLIRPCGGAGRKAWIITPEGKQPYRAYVRKQYADPRLRVSGMRVQVMPGFRRGTLIERRILSEHKPSSFHFDTPAYKRWRQLAQIVYLSTVDVGQPIKHGPFVVGVRHE